MTQCILKLLLGSEVCRWSIELSWSWAHWLTVLFMKCTGIVLKISLMIVPHPAIVVPYSVYAIGLQTAVLKSLPLWLRFSLNKALKFVSKEVTQNRLIDLFKVNIDWWVHILNMLFMLLHINKRFFYIRLYQTCSHMFLQRHYLYI